MDMTEIHLGLDVDGVVADLHGYIMTKMGLDPAKLTTWDIASSFGSKTASEFHSYFLKPSTWVDLDPLPKAEIAIAHLSNHNIEPTFISCIRDEMKPLREWWLTYHFGKHIRIHFACAPDHGEPKAKVARNLGVTHFADDNPRTASAMAKAGIYSVLVPTSYAKPDELDPGVHVSTLLGFVRRLTINDPAI